MISGPFNRSGLGEEVWVGWEFQEQHYVLSSISDIELNLCCNLTPLDVCNLNVSPNIELSLILHIINRDYCSA